MFLLKNVFIRIFVCCYSDNLWPATTISRLGIDNMIIDYVKFVYSNHGGPALSLRDAPPWRGLRSIARGPSSFDNDNIYN